MMKNILIAIICGVGLLGCFDKKDDDTIIVGLSSDYPPFEFQMDGVIMGFDVDLAEAIAKKLDKKLIIKDMPLYSLIASLQNKSIDMIISGISPTLERAKSVAFSDIYYGSNMALLYDSSKTSIDVLDDIAGKTIGAQTGTTMETYLKELNDLQGLTVVSQDNNNQLVEHLKIGRIHAVLLDLDQAIAFSNASPSFVYLAIPTPDSYGFAIALNRAAIELRDKVNDIIAEMKSNGEMNKLKAKWLSSGADDVVPEDAIDYDVNDDLLMEHEEVESGDEPVAI